MDCDRLAGDSARRPNPPLLRIILVTIAILIVLLLPATHVPTFRHLQASHPVGLAVHVALFLVWSLVLAYDVPALRRPARPRACLIVPIALAFGLVTELLQDATEMQRTFAIDDLFADGVGAVLAVIVILVARQRRASN